MFSRPELCRICRCPALDTGVRVGELNPEKLGAWWEMQQRLPKIKLDDVAEILDSQICQFCIWDARSKEKLDKDADDCDWWTGHDTNKIYTKFYFEENLIRPCRVRIQPLDLPSDSNIRILIKRSAELTQPLERVTKRRRKDSHQTNRILRGHSNRRTGNENPVQAGAMQSSKEEPRESQFIPDIVKCGYCSESLDRDLFYLHIARKHLTRYPLCDFYECPAGRFSSFKNKQEHVLLDHSQDLYLYVKCLFCEFKAKKQEMETHLVNWHESQFSFSYCKYDWCYFCTSEADELEKHVLEVHVNPALDFDSERKLNSKSFVQEHDTAMRVMCPRSECSSSFATEEVLQNHLEESHTSAGAHPGAQTLVDECVTKAPPRCPSRECSSSTRELDESVHQNFDSGSLVVRSRKCKVNYAAVKCFYTQCSRRFESKEDLQSHLQNDHNIEQTRQSQEKIKSPFVMPVEKLQAKKVLVEPSNPIFHCRVIGCTWSFGSADKLNRHNDVVHSDSEPLKCGYCEKFFSRNAGQQYVSEHLQQCKLEQAKLGQPLRCQHGQCNEYFASEADLRCHITTNHIKIEQSESEKAPVEIKSEMVEEVESPITGPIRGVKKTAKTHFLIRNAPDAPAVQIASETECLNSKPKALKQKAPAKVVTDSKPTTNVEPKTCVVPPYVVVNEKPSTRVSPTTSKKTPVLQDPVFLQRCQFSNCSFSCSSSQSLMLHVEHTHLLKLKCFGCKKNFPTHSTLSEHQKKCEHVKRTRVVKMPRVKFCSFEGCAFSYHLQSKLEEHLREHHSLENSSRNTTQPLVITKQPEDPLLRCKFDGCSFVCSSEDERTKHVAEKHLKIECEGCDEKFSHRLDLFDHAKQKHLSDVSICPFRMCGRRFKSIVKVRVHLREEHEPEAFKCKKCFKVHSDPLALARHARRCL